MMRLGLCYRLGRNKIWKSLESHYSRFFKLKMEDAVEITPPLPHPRNLKYLTTLAVLFGNITFGCTFNFFSPALEVLRNKYDCSVEEISKVFTVMLVLYCIGALTGGIVYNFINRQLGVIFCLSGMTFVLCVTPYLPSKELFFVIGGLLGYCCGAYDSAQMVWLIEIWQGKAGPLIQAQNFSYALGSNLPPLLLGPFLSSKSDDTDVVLGAGSGESKIYIPFTIAGVFSASALCYQLFLFIFIRYYKPPLQDTPTLTDPTESTDPGTSGSANSYEEEVADTLFPIDDTASSELIAADKQKINWPKVKIIALSAMFFGAYCGMEICTIQFIPTFGKYCDLKLSEADSAYILGGLTAAFAVGRFIGIFVVFKLQPQLLLVGNLILVLSGNLILLNWASSDYNMFWLGCILLGAGFSTMYPSYCAYVEKHILFSNGVGALMIITGSVTAAIYPLVIGRAIEHNVVILCYTNFLSISVCTLALVLSSRLTYGNKIKFG